MILSHTWGAEEVSLQELDGSNITDEEEGYIEVLETLARARKMGLSGDGLIPAVLIRRDSAELSESINSMYRVRPSCTSLFSLA